MTLASPPRDDRYLLMFFISIYQWMVGENTRKDITYNMGRQPVNRDRMVDIFENIG